MRSLITPLGVSAMLLFAGTALAQEDEIVLARFIEYVKAGNQAEIVNMADKVVSAAEKVLADSPEALANDFGSIAEAYNSQGQYALAEPLSKRALAIRFYRESAASLRSAFDLSMSRSEVVLVPHVQHASRNVIRDQKVRTIEAPAIRLKPWAYEEASRA